MRLGRSQLLTVVLVVALSATAMAGCGGGAATSTGAPGSPVNGPIVEVRGPRGAVEAIVVKQGDELVEVAIADDVAYGFDLEHLRDHLATGDPVSCTVELRGDTLYALRILDG
jgi:hypothetical protein